MANTFRNDTFRSAKNVSYLSVGLLGGLIFFSFLFILSSILLLAYPDWIFDLGDEESMPFATVSIGMIALIHIPIFIASIVTFLVWEYRSFNNLSALKARNLEFSPGWVVGWWFVPFAALFKPFQAMRELWIESDPDYDEECGFLSSSIGAPTVMGIWWATWILMGIADRVSNKFEDDLFFPVALIVGSFLEIIAAGLLIELILDIGERQEKRYERLGNKNELPPVPPEFG